MTWLVLMTLLAAPTGPRVLLRADTQRDVQRQLSSELTALGFQVELDTSKEPLTWRALRKKARDASAIAAIQLQEGEGELELWVSDLSTGKVLIRALPTLAAASPRVVALRVVELLRVSFREVGEPSTKDVVEAAPPPAPVLTALEPPPVPPLVWLSVGAMAQVSPGGVAPSVQLLVGAGLKPLQWLTLGVDGWVPVTTARLTGPEGSAELRFWSAHLGASVTPWTLGIIEPGLSLRLGVTGAELVGTAVAPFVGRLERVLVPSGALGVTTRFVLSTSLALRAEVFIAASVPPIVVMFGEREAGRWGQPSAGLNVSLEVGVNRRSTLGP